MGNHQKIIVMKKSVYVKKGIVALLVILGIALLNSAYWLFSDKQDRCIEKINSGKNLSVYELASLATLHMGICTVGWLYCPLAAEANMKMWTTRKDTVYIESRSWVSPKIRKRIRNNEWGKVAWDGNEAYQPSSPEKTAALTLNWCMLKKMTIKDKPCVAAVCDYTWEKPSKTQFHLGFATIRVYEQLFYELEKRHVLHKFKLVCYYEE